jgi:hypothetical protein
VCKQILSKNNIKFKFKFKIINYKKTLKIMKKIIIINKYIKDFFIYFKKHLKIINFIIILNELKLILKKNL